MVLVLFAYLTLFYEGNTFIMRSNLKTNEVTEIYRYPIVGSEHVVLDFIHQSQCISWSTHISMTSVVEF